MAEKLVDLIPKNKPKTRKRFMDSTRNPGRKGFRDLKPGDTFWWFDPERTRWKEPIQLKLATTYGIHKRCACGCLEHAPGLRYVIDQGWGLFYLVVDGADVPGWLASMSYAQLDADHNKVLLKDCHLTKAAAWRSYIKKLPKGYFEEPAEWIKDAEALCKRQVQQANADAAKTIDKAREEWKKRQELRRYARKTLRMKV